MGVSDFGRGAGMQNIKRCGGREETSLGLSGINPDPQQEVVVGRSFGVLAGLVAAIAFTTLYILTVVETTADTPVYVNQILQYHLKGASASSASLWEFGHLLWRPLGYGLWRVLHPVLFSWFGDNSWIQITAILMGINFVVGIGLTILLLLLCDWLGLTKGISIAVTSGFMLFSTILRYVHSGMSYNLGFMFQIAALLLIAHAMRTDRRQKIFALLGGVALALSFAVWFPYVLTVPSILLAAWFVNSTGRATKPNSQEVHIRVLAFAACATAILGLSLFATGAAINHLSSYAALKDWVVSSKHGYVPENRLVRLPTGIARSFLYFGDQGVALKRFVFGDVYAPVRITDLLPALWKVILVFLTLTVISIALARHSWRALLVLLCGFVPIIAFAVLLFETSEPARYQPAYPALLIAVVVVLSIRKSKKFYRYFLALFLGIMATVNLTAFAWTLRSTNSKVSERAKLVHDHAAPRGVAFVLSIADPLSTFVQRSPLSPLNRQGALPLFHVIEPGNARMVTWRRDAACRVLQAWDDGGDAWLSDRLTANRPKPDWGWVEKEDSRIHWSDVRDFFNRFSQNAHIGAEDGFFRVSPTPENLDQLHSLCEGTQSNNRHLSE